MAPRLLSSLRVSRTLSASDWCALQAVPNKCIDTIQYTIQLVCCLIDIGCVVVVASALLVNGIVEEKLKVAETANDLVEMDELKVNIDDMTLLENGQTQDHLMPSIVV